MSFNQVWSGSIIAPAASVIVWRQHLMVFNTEHLMVVETLFPNGVILATCFLKYTILLLIQVKVRFAKFSLK